MAESGRAAGKRVTFSAQSRSTPAVYFSAPANLQKHEALTGGGDDGHADGFRHRVPSSGAGASEDRPDGGGGADVTGVAPPDISSHGDVNGGAGGAGGVCVHPGTATDDDRADGEDMQPKASDFYDTSATLPDRFNNPASAIGYGRPRQHPLYKTSNSEYGAKHPSVHTTPTTYHPRTMGFSETLGKTGMYRDRSVNL